jgi:superfamily II DNA or RNA helicase
MTTSILNVTLSTDIRLNPPIPPALAAELRQHFTLRNPKFEEAEENGRSTRDLPEHLTYYCPTRDGGLSLPRGAAELVSQLCKARGVTIRCEDRAQLAEPIAFHEQIRLSLPQERAVRQMLTRRMGVLEAPAGSGKTVMAMALIARRQQPALMIVHTVELARQAIARAGMVLGLDAAEVGLIGDGEWHIGDRLTVALVQSLSQGIPPTLLEVGHIILDEAHHAPAEQTAAVIGQFPARYLLGLTATPFRRDGLDDVIGWTMGPVVARMDRSALADRLVKPRVVKRVTGITLHSESFSGLVTQLTAHPLRNALIVEDVRQGALRGRRCIVLSDRVSHVCHLARLLRRADVAAEALHSKVARKERRRIVGALDDGALSVVVATTALLSEGFDCPALDALFLTTPVSFEGRVEQILGRISRAAPGKRDAVLVDYCDNHAMLWASWGRRAAVYRRLAGGIETREVAA